MDRQANISHSNIAKGKVDFLAKQSIGLRLNDLVNTDKREGRVCISHILQDPFYLVIGIQVYRVISYQLILWRFGKVALSEAEGLEMQRLGRSEEYK